MLFIAVLLYCCLTVVVVLFQLALACGAPWGHLAMGGKFPGKFPPGMRVAAVIQSIVLVGLALVVVSRSGLAAPALYGFSATAIWVVVAFASVAFVMNSITPSRGERILWAPVAALLLLSSAFVALS